MDVVTPSISVVKTAVAAADGTTLYTNGGDVTYSYLVTNTGEVNLADITSSTNSNKHRRHITLHMHRRRRIGAR